MSLFGIGAAPVFSAVAGFLGASQKNKANSAANAQMIEWERERAKNAHQWEVEDLRKAGLNPILSAGGSGASTSGVSIIPSGESPYSNAVNSGITGMLTNESLKSAKKQNNILDSNILGLGYDLDVKAAEANTAKYWHGFTRGRDGLHMYLPEHNYALQSMMNSLDNSAKTNEILQEQLNSLRFENERKKKIAEVYGSDFGYALAALESMPWLGSLLGVGGNIVASRIKKPSSSTHSHYHSTNIYNK